MLYFLNVVAELMNDNIGRKITILLPTFRGGSDELKHLFFILTDPCLNKETGANNCVLLVNCSTIKDGFQFDDTCILETGEHEFIKKRSFIYYKEARIEQLSTLKNGIKQGRFIKKEIINDELYIKILKGLLKTQAMPRMYLRFLKGAIQQNACLNVFNLCNE